MVRRRRRMRSRCGCVVAIAVCRALMIVLRLGVCRAAHPCKCSLIGGGNIMKSIEDYQARANEYACLADSASDKLLRAELLLKMKTYLGVVARLRNYAAGKGLSVPTSQ